MDELVQKLSQGNHPLEASLRPEKTIEALKESIDRGFVHIRFTQTRGGTELGVRLDREASDLFNYQAENIHLVGDLTLNYVKVRAVVDIDLKSLSGLGYLEPLR